MPGQRERELLVTYWSAPFAGNEGGNINVNLHDVLYSTVSLMPYSWSLRNVTQLRSDFAALATAVKRLAVVYYC